jgi:hypothetical protein
VNHNILRAIRFSLLLSVIAARPSVTAAATVPAPQQPCAECLVGPVELRVDKGEPRHFQERFNADPAGNYTLVVEQLGQLDMSALILLNGRILVPFKQTLSPDGPRRAGGRAGRAWTSSHTSPWTWSSSATFCRSAISVRRRTRFPPTIST